MRPPPPTRRRYVFFGVAAIAVAGFVGFLILRGETETVAMRWDFGPDGAPGPNAKAFSIILDTQRCNDKALSVDRIEVDETSEAVTVSAYGTRSRVESGEDCLTGLGADVALERPVSGRQLLDGFHDPPKVQAGS